jgi:hypothetical protein
MKGGKRKLHSFASRLTRRIVLVLLIIMGLTAFWLFVLGGTFVQEEEAYRHEAILESTAENICRVASDIYVAARNQVPVIEESLDRPDHLMKLVERAVAQNPASAASASVSSRGIIQARGAATCPMQ